jgi:hypothetical protein
VAKPKPKGLTTDCTDDTDGFAAKEHSVAEPQTKGLTTNGHEWTRILNGREAKGRLWHNSIVVDASRPGFRLVWVIWRLKNVSGEAI